MQVFGKTRRDAVLAKVIKMLRLSRAAGTQAEAHTALTLAQQLMYAHDIAEDDVVVDGDRSESEPIEDTVVDETGHHVAWKEYLAAIIAENFRCAYVISESRSSGNVRLVFLGRRNDATVAGEAYRASAAVAAHLAERCVLPRDEADRPAARASFLTGFLKGLLERFAESASANALAVVVEDAVTQHALGFTNAGTATGGALPHADADALRDGFESGYAHGAGKRRLDS